MRKKSIGNGSKGMKKMRMTEKKQRGGKEKKHKFRHKARKK